MNQLEADCNLYLKYLEVDSLPQSVQYLPHFHNPIQAFPFIYSLILKAVRYFFALH